MNDFVSRIPLSTLIAAFAVLTGISHASAQDCTSDSECSPGFVCTTSTSQTCSAMAPIACPDNGEPCPEPEPPTCETFEYSYCTSAPCATNADCPSDMVCYAQPYTECTVHASAGAGGSAGGTAGSCADGEACAPASMEPYECVERPGEPVCVAKYVPPCSADADCGPGFSCQEQIDYECSGGVAGSSAPSTGGVGGGDSMGGGDDTGSEDMKPDEPYSCTETPSGRFACVLQDLPCEADSDCPGTLKCHESWGYTCNGGGVAGAGTAGASTAGAGGANGSGDPGAASPPPATMPMAPADGGVEDPDRGESSCESVLIAKSCSPDDYYGGYPPPTMIPGGSTGSGSAGGSASDPGSQDAGVTPGPGSANGGAGGAASGESASDGDEEPTASLPGHRRFGCAVDNDGATDALWSLSLIGLATLVLRRRARKPT